MKTCLVGFTPDQSGQSALALGQLLSAERGTPLVVCTVIPEVWSHPALSAVDQEYADHRKKHARETLDKARSFLADVPGVRYLSYPAKSATVGLTEAAAQADAELIVLGSSRAGSTGRLSLGSMSSEILHLSSLPVAVAPRGFRVRPGQRISRLSCAFAGTEMSSGTSLEALWLANLLGVPLRLVAFAVRDRQMYTSVAGYKAENMVVDAWRERTEAVLESFRTQLAGHQPPIEVAMAGGESWEDAVNAVDWQVGELLALGSSRMGMLARVFLGSNGTKIMRASPVPVIVLPKVS